jgi:putative CRISPR-associated protein (TIGR02619 family)
MGAKQSARRLVLSTCGTSVLTNSSGSEERSLLSRTANLREPSGPDEEQLVALCNVREQALLQADVSKARRMSAEINGILALYEGEPSRAKGDIHLLLPSDTWQGRQAKRLVEGWLQQHGMDTGAIARALPGLRTECLAELHEVLPKLVEWCATDLQGYRMGGYQVVFNLTGGFKSVTGFLQALGMFYADEIVYLFESESQLLRIPRLPMQPDFEGWVRQHLDVLRLIAHELPVSPEQRATIPESLLLSIGDEVVLSVWGQLVWDRGRVPLYQERLLPPLPPLAWAAAFEKEARKLEGREPQRLQQLNERLEELARAVSGGPNPSSLRYKALAGAPHPPSTHEFYPWTGDSRRAFLHRKGDTYLVDSLDRHL